MTGCPSREPDAEAARALSPNLDEAVCPLLELERADDAGTARLDAHRRVPALVAHAHVELRACPERRVLVERHGVAPRCEIGLP